MDDSNYISRDKYCYLIGDTYFTTDDEALAGIYFTALRMTKASDADLDLFFLSADLSVRVARYGKDRSLSDDPDFRELCGSLKGVTELCRKYDSRLLGEIAEAVTACIKRIPRN